MTDQPERKNNKMIIQVINLMEILRAITWTPPKTPKDASNATVFFQFKIIPIPRDNAYRWFHWNKRIAYCLLE